MSYQSNVPLGTDAPSASAADFRNNFGQIFTVNGVNHEDFNTADAGKHKFLQMPEQGGAPATAANEGAVYTKAVSGATQLFYREESNGTELQLTNAYTAASIGELTLPGGLTIKWGTKTMVGTTEAVTYGSPFTTATYNVQLTAGSSNASMSVASLTAAGFQAFCETANLPYYWVAIGL